MRSSVSRSGRTRAGGRGALLAAAAAVAVVVAVLTTAAPSWAAITGPDVSKWQHPDGAAIDWRRVRAAGNSFAFVKASEGPNGDRTGGRYYTNEWFARDWAAAGAAGLARGAYHYAQPSTVPSVAVSARNQARYYVSVTGTLRGRRDLPPVLDLETSGGLSPSQLLVWARTWLREVQALTGRAPMIYTYEYFWQKAMADTAALSGYRLWFARYTNDATQVDPPGGWDTWTFWQYSSTGSIPGVPARVDLDRYCCSRANFAALADGGAAPAAASNPFGRFDPMRRWPGGLAVRGWAIDPDTTDPVKVDFWVDGRYAASTLAAQPSPGLARAYPGFGTAHGFSAVVPVTAGRRTVCAYALNVGYGSGNRRLGCRTVTVSSAPYGALEKVVRTLGGVRLSGWAIDPDVAEPTAVDVWVDGRFAAKLPADRARSDVAAANPGYGAGHGYAADVPIVAPGEHRLCAYALNRGAGRANTRLGCRQVTISPLPFGAVGSVSVGSQGLRVGGWAIDPDVVDPIRVDVWVDGRYAGSGLADAPRGDVARVFPAYGPDHGIALNLPDVTRGREICLYGINTAAGRGNTRLGCRTL